MSRQIVALIVGLAVLGLATSLYFSTKEAGVEQVLDEDFGAPLESGRTVEITVAGSGEIYVLGRQVDIAGLEQEVETLLESAREDGSPEPSFQLLTDPDVETGQLLLIMDAIQRAGSTSVAFEVRQSDE